MEKARKGKLQIGNLVLAERGVALNKTTKKRSMIYQALILEETLAGWARRKPLKAALGHSERESELATLVEPVPKLSLSKKLMVKKE